MLKTVCRILIEPFIKSNKLIFFKIDTERRREVKNEKEGEHITNDYSQRVNEQKKKFIHDSIVMGSFLISL